MPATRNSILSNVSTYAIIAIVILLTGILNFYFAEQFPTFGGAFGASLRFISYAQNLPYMLDYGAKLEGSHVYGRMLPSTIIYIYGKLFGINWKIDETTHFFVVSQQIVNAYRILNLALFFLSGYLWLKIMQLMSIGRQGQFLGLICLLVNYYLLVYYWLIPAFTDQMAFFLGMLTLYGYLKKNYFILYASLFLNFFGWPPGTYSILFLLAMPRTEDNLSYLNNAKYPKIVSFLAAISIIIIAFYIHYIDQPCIPGVENATIDQLVPISMLMVFGYIYFGTYHLLNHRVFYNPVAIYRLISVKNLVYGILMLIALKLTVELKFDVLPRMICEDREYDIFSFFISLTRLAISRPLGFFVSHVYFFGPFLFITAFFWKSLSKIVHNYGIGLTAFFLMTLLSSLDSESRHLIWVLPFMVAFTLKSIEHLKWKPVYSIFFLLLSLAFSKKWMAQLPNYRQEEIVFYLEYLHNDFKTLMSKAFEFPLQRIFMNHGPWMNDKMYVVQGLILLATCIVVYVFIFKPLTKD